jgi:asparagine synthase (glutamine-hydrolysing)
MCGIAGVLGVADKKTAQALIAPLAHRGPDGIRVRAVSEAALAHARLSIIDLETGWQPLQAARSTIVGNGEIYNYIELTEQFGFARKLKTGSDFEPLLQLYALEGETAFQRLRGMYAFCLVGGDGRTWFVRDPFGIKPLYVNREKGRISFASEPQPLQHGGVDHARAEELLALNYTLGSIFPGVERLPPGTFSTAHPMGSEDPQFDPRARAIPALVPGLAREPENPVAALDAVLEDSVRVHQRSDVPYGLFLSGGIDSAAIATVMSRINDKPVTAFTCGFDAPGAADERAQAEKVATALGLDWRETRFTEEDFWRIAPLVAKALDDPTTDYATLPTYKLAEAARGTLTVVLTGEGGDELFGGYGRYRRALRPVWLGGRAAEPQIDARFLKDRGAGALQRWRAFTAPPSGLTRLQEAQWRDVAGWLPNDLLLKLDRCLMAHGLEGRTPFLDREVAAFAFNLPDRLKVRGRYGKWLLRTWLETHCPAAEPWAKKQGFTVPVADWIAPRAAGLGPKIAAVQGIAEVCDLDAVRAVFTHGRQAHNRWRLLFYALWWQIHLGGASPAEAADSLGF